MSNCPNTTLWHNPRSSSSGVWRSITGGQITCVPQHQEVSLALGTDAWSLLVEWLRQWPDWLWLWRWSRLSRGRMSSLHQIHFDIYQVVSYLPQRLVTVQHHLTATLCLGEVGGLSPASGEVHEYSMKGNAGTTPDWTGGIFSLESGSELGTGACWEGDLWSAWNNKPEIHLINTGASSFSLTAGLTFCGTNLQHKDVQHSLTSRKCSKTRWCWKCKTALQTQCKANTVALWK